MLRCAWEKTFLARDGGEPRLKVSENCHHMTMSNQLASALEKLSKYRAQSSRQSQEVVDAGVLLLAKKSVRNPDAETCAWLEQLALAAIDVGKLDIADVRYQPVDTEDVAEPTLQDCIMLLKGNFKESPRVDVLVGIRKEASQSPETVLEYYDTLLKNDESNAVRCVLHHSSKRDDAAQLTGHCFQGCVEAEDLCVKEVGCRTERCRTVVAVS